MIEIEVAEGVATATLCRAPVNAISTAWIASFHAVLDGLGGRSDWSVLHLRSDRKVFCAGADLREIEGFFGASDGGDRMAAFVDSIQRLFARIEALPQATLAELAGAAMGGGLELALACDIRVAADEARLGLPEVGLGLLPGAGGTQRLTRLCGSGVASRVILAGDIVTGAEALTLGIVQFSEPPSEVGRFTANLARRMARASPAAVAEGKTCIAACSRPDADGFELERRATARLFRNADTRRRIAGFLDGARATAGRAP